MRFSFTIAACILVFTSTQQKALCQEQVSLEEVISLALEKNYDVQLAKNLSESAATDEKYVLGAFLPQINANGSYRLSSSNQEFQFEDASRDRSGVARSNMLAGTVGLSWTLFDGTRMFATRERVNEIAEQGELLVKDQMNNTIASVIINYYTIVRQKQQLRAIQEQMAVSEERVKLADRKLEVGTGGKPELLQAKVDLNAQRTQVLEQQAAIRQLKDQLNGLVGQKLPAQFDVADTIVINLGIDEPEVFTGVENSNYGLLGLRKNIDIARLSLYERKAERLPFISFDAAYNFSQTNNIRLINIFGALYSESSGLSYGLSFTLPILNGFNNRRLIEQAKITISSQQLRFDQQRMQVDIGLRNAFVNYTNAREVLLIEEENIGLARENVFIALEGFKRGITTFIELRTAQQSLEDAFNRLIAARYNAKVAETELLRLKGGLLK